MKTRITSYLLLSLFISFFLISISSTAIADFNWSNSIENKATLFQNTNYDFTSQIYNESNPKFAFDNSSIDFINLSNMSNIETYNATLLDNYQISLLESNLTRSQDSQFQMYYSSNSSYQEYPATYTFENEIGKKDIEIDWIDELGWSFGNTYAEVISEYDNHSTVMNYSENDSSWHSIKDKFDNQQIGSVEFWINMDSNSKYHTILLSEVIFIAYRSDGLLGIYNGSWHILGDYIPNVWYLNRISFNTITDTFDWFINDILIGNDYQFVSKIDYVNEMKFRNLGCSSYIDAIGYSWDPNYSNGKNGYWFNYNATYDFENDNIGSEPENWTIFDCGGVAKVSGLTNEHKKVLEMYDNNLLGGIEGFTTFPEKSTGIIEFWIKVSDVDKGMIIAIFDDVITAGIFIVIMDGQIKYYHLYLGYTVIKETVDINTWYHFRIGFNCSSQWYIEIDGERHGNYDYYKNPDNSTVIAMDTLKFMSTTGQVDYYCWVDAVGFSWDSNYYIGKNQEIPLYSLSLDINDTFNYGNELILLSELNIWYKSNRIIDLNCEIFNYSSNQWINLFNTSSTVNTQFSYALNSNNWFLSNSSIYGLRIYFIDNAPFTFSIDYFNFTFWMPSRVNFTKSFSELGSYSYRFIYFWTDNQIINYTTVNTLTNYTSEWINFTVIAVPIFSYGLKIPFYVFIILIVIPITLMVLFRKWNKNDKPKLIKMYFPNSLGLLGLLLLTLDSISVYLTVGNENESNWVFTALNALIFGVFLNIVGLNGKGIFKKTSLKGTTLFILVVLALSGFGFFGILIVFNFPLNLLFFYDIFNKSMSYGIRFFSSSILFFSLIIFFSFLVESEREA